MSQQANFDEVKQHAMERIPGAVFLDMSILRDLKAPYPHMMPSNEHFVRMMKTLNIRKSMTVVIYDTKNSFFASRAAFMLQSFGHEKFSKVYRSRKQRKYLIHLAPDLDSLYSTSCSCKTVFFIFDTVNDEPVRRKR